MARALDDLLTPALCIDVERVDANLRRMQAYADAHSLALRPHIKTHRLPAFARRQLELGAVGITCQKLGEAEVMADAGCADILLSYEIVGGRNLRRLTDLACRVRLTVVADSVAVADGLSTAAARAGVRLPVLVDGDTGYRRTGVASPAEAVTLARRVAGLPGLEFVGLFTYPTLPGTRAWLTEALEGLHAAGLRAAVVSSGGTPGALHTHEVPEISELRVGTYIYNDRATVRSGFAGLEDCAATVLATVVSANAPERVILDAGSKALAADLLAHDPGLGHGEILGHPAAAVQRLYEEHAVVDMSRCARLPRVGERLAVVPNHVCAAVNLFDEAALVQAGAVLEVLPIAARGRSS